MEKIYFNPGCALSIYKPQMVQQLLITLNQHYGNVQLHDICCHFNPRLEKGSLIINVCAGCDRRFRSLYEGITTISLWEILDSLPNISLPDYKGMKLSVHDACPVREKPLVHKAVRNLLHKMNIDVVEAEHHGTGSICCGDDLYPKLPIEQIHQHMKKRAASMPCEEVCVYCISCIKSMHIGGKQPRYLPDLLLDEGTEPQVYDTKEWHEQLQAYIDTHTGEG
jgi:Fe-S oxidoreductase